jgi:muramoyltetrapeptide carboxypeptidase
MTKPEMLKGKAVYRGDRIALVAPASPPDNDVIDAGLAEISKLGYEPVHDETLFARQGYLAGSAETRAESFVRAWMDPTVVAIMAVRGGYGSMQVLPLLDADLLRRSPKLFIGYSDTTAISAWLTCKARITALYGPMIDGELAMGNSSYDELSLVRLLAGENEMLLEPPGVRIEREGNAAGVLYGGTLTQIVASLGTPYAFDPPENCVLFLEDTNERPYRIDRMLTQLRQAGILSRASGLVFGEMRGCDEPGDLVRVEEVIAEATKGLIGPMLMGFPSGHTTGPCWSLPLGTRVRIVTSPNPSVIVEESVVK